MPHDTLLERPTPRPDLTPVNPPQPLHHPAPRYAAGLFTGLALAAVAALAFRSARHAS